MSDIIQLLPDSVANQIAAGEVIQRPASVIKELIENAVDAGADNISVTVKDAGKTLIQITDNGSGMSPTDARLSFERHATSKIQKAEDLFSINTMGFRGEALASIAAIAHVELKTRLHEEEIGTHLIIKGSEVISQEPVACSTGSSMSVKNLFYNIPARRKFLKKNATELTHIINEFRKVAFTRPDIDLTLIHNENTIYKLEKGTRQQRIIGLMGKNTGKHLIPINSKTSIIEISGFIGKPEIAKKVKPDTYFFVNNRYMRHPYFHKAVTSAYERIIGDGTIPAYFLYINVSPEIIDINIHPQKTEINFENSPAIFQIIRATVREGLGKFNIVPSIDFQGAISIPHTNKDKQYEMPELDINKSFNPFAEEYGNKEQTGKTYFPSYNKGQKRTDFGNWEELYKGFDQDETGQQNLDTEKSIFGGNFFQIQNKYIICQTEAGLTIIDQKRAHQRILYNEFMEIKKIGKIPIQKLLYPESITLKPDDFAIFYELKNEITEAGFDIQLTVKNELIIKGVPGIFSEINIGKTINTLINDIKSEFEDIKKRSKEKMAELLAKAYSIDYGKKLENKEISELLTKLFASKTPNYSPSNKLIIKNITFDEISKYF